MEGKKKKTQGQFKPTIENMQQQSLKQKDKKKQMWQIEVHRAMN